MRSINELLGIIKGISYDGIINDMEVKKLEKWVAENRNLVYKAKHIEMIALLDDILEDHIITDDERVALENKCNELRGISSKGSTSFILHGILNGIISDGIINEKEISNLKLWMDINGRKLESKPKLNNLKKVIDELIGKTESVIDMQKEPDLLDRLYFAIDEARLEITKNYICDKVKNHENIGLDIIGLLSDEKAIEEIHRLGEEKLEIIINSHDAIRENREIVFVSLVINAIMNYNEGRFYEGLMGIYDSLYRRYSDQRIAGYVRTILDYYFNNDKNNRRSITSALSNSIVPVYYLEPFFEFIYDIYRVNFQYNLPKNLQEEFRFIYEGLRYKMVANDDALTVDATKKAYKLIASTKALILDEKNESSLESLIELSIIIIRLIDKHMWNKDIKIYNPYLKEGYEKWIDSLTKVDYSDKSAHKKTVELYSRWEPKFICKDSMIYLLPPVHKIKRCFGYEDIRIELSKDGKVLYENDYPDIREIIGGYEVIPDIITINEPIGKLQYKVYSGEEIIYSSKDSLHREFIIFDTYGREIKNNTYYEGTAILCLNALNDSDEFDVYYSNENYKLATISVDKGDILYIAGNVFSFTAIGMAQVVGNKYDDVFIFDEDGSQSYPVYGEINCITFDSKNGDAIYEIEINGIPYRLDAFEFLHNTSGIINKYIVDMQGMIDSGVNKVNVYEIFEGHRNKIASYIFAVDKSLNYEVEKGEEYIVLVESDLLDEGVLREIKVRDYDPKWLEFNASGKAYYYSLPLGLEYYMLSTAEECWIDSNKSIWIEDIKVSSVLKIADTSIQEILIYDEYQNLIDENIELKDKTMYKEANISTLLSYKNDLRFVDIRLIKDNKVSWTIRCYNQCVLTEELESKYDAASKTMKFIPKYEGNGKVYCVVKSDDGAEICNIDTIVSGEEYAVSNIETSNIYKVEFYQKKSGLSLFGVKELKSYQVFFLNLDDLIGKSFAIKAAYYDSYLKDKYEMKYLDFRGIDLEITSKVGDGFYKGSLLINMNGKIYRNYYDCINPVTVEICSEVYNNNCLEISLTKDGDGLLLDRRKRRILNNLDDLSAVDGMYYEIIINRG